MAMTSMVITATNAITVTNATPFDLGKGDTFMVRDLFAKPSDDDRIDDCACGCCNGNGSGSSSPWGQCERELMFHS